MILDGYLVASAALFTLGVVLFLSKKNAIAILMGVELILNASAINFVAFGKFTPSQGSPFDGQIFAIFIILLAAAEAVVALAIVLAAYKEYKHIMVDQYTKLRG
ncbi:MAG: NADH-quinone oxidoreductase subunit NuoK [Deltaproteobacteria bacterium]|nr:NADH-quinone oxidoreductase subunit NuoK [Deltaproteobacteria bacterium]